MSTEYFYHFYGRNSLSWWICTILDIRNKIKRIFPEMRMRINLNFNIFMQIYAALSCTVGISKCSQILEINQMFWLFVNFWRNLNKSFWLFDYISDLPGLQKFSKFIAPTAYKSWFFFVCKSKLIGTVDNKIPQIFMVCLG